MRTVLHLTAFLFLAGPILAQGVELYPFPENGKWGYIDAAGEKIIPADYDSAAPFSEGLGRVGKEANGMIFYGFVNQNGEEVIPPKYNEVSPFKGGVAIARIRGQYACLLPSGALSDQLFDEISPVSEGLSRFKKGGLYGYAAPNGGVVIPAAYIEAEDFSQGVALVRQGDFYGYIGKQGTFIIPPLFPEARSFSEGAAAVRTGEGWNLINKSGDILTTRPYEAMWPLNSGLARVVFNGNFAFIDASGELVIPFVPGSADDFSSGLARVSEEGRIGYINKKAEYINGTGMYTNAPVYPFTAGTAFDGRLARVASGNSNGFMNAEGRFNLSDKVVSIGSFFRNRARMKVGRYYGFFDEEARTKIKPVYLQAGEFQSALAPVLAPVPGGYRAAYINTNGEEVFSWNVFAKPVPADKENLFVIARTLPFFRESNPDSPEMARMKYGARVEKVYQRTATPLSGLGLKGLLYAVSSYGKVGFLFSEALSVFPPPVAGMGLFAYFRDKFGLISLSPESGNKTTASFFNGAVMNRTLSGNETIDRYYVPYMKPSEAFFLFSAALDAPVDAYPREGAGDFTGSIDGNGVPEAFTALIKGHLLAVTRAGEGLQVEHRYPSL